jgi:nucleotide sugar dehydrogenase
MNIVDDQRGSLTIWGAGLSGYTLARALSETGRRCMLVDIDQRKLERIAEGELPFDYEASFLERPSPEVAARLLTTTDAAVATCERVHIICVPTERHGEIWCGALAEVMASLTAGAKPPIFIIIESTIAPSWLDSVVHEQMRRAGWEHGSDYHVACSPRRDVFGCPELSLGAVGKVFGADTPEAAALVWHLYAPIWPQLHRASSCAEAILVKLVENAMRHSAIELANVVATGYPTVDVARVLRLVATKWNMSLYYPSLGAGGYCIPIAKDYLAESAAPQWKEPLSRIGANSPQCADAALDVVAEHPGRIGILGLAYAPELKVHTGSPTLALVEKLRARGREVAVHDPLYAPEEIERLLGVPSFRYPDDLRGFDVLVVVTHHRAYRRIDPDQLASSGVRTIFDNGGGWRGERFPPAVRYVQVGAAGYYAEAACTAAPSNVSDRAYLRALEQSGELPALHVLVGRLLEVNRPYLRVDFDGTRLSMPELSERLRPLRDTRVDDLSDVEVDILCAMAALSSSWTRLEYVDMKATMPEVRAHLDRTMRTYVDALAEKGCRPTAASEGPWWVLAPALTRTREEVDVHYCRVAEIDGATWARREFLLDRNLFDASRLHPHVLRRLSADCGFELDDDGADALAKIREWTVRTIDRLGSPVPLLHALMRAAADDPHIRADHTTLLCPRGTKLGEAWNMTREDFLAHVIFNDAFVPTDFEGVGNRDVIQRAMLAHHAAKKTKLARKYRARYGTNTVASLNDNLGDLGLFHNESAHHKGHQVSGISTALRFLTAIDVRRDGTSWRVEGLTDFRLTRASSRFEDRFTLSQLTWCAKYGHWVRVLLEETFARGIVLPASARTEPDARGVVEHVASEDAWTPQLP